MKLTSNTIIRGMVATTLLGFGLYSIWHTLSFGISHFDALSGYTWSFYEAHEVGIGLLEFAAVPFVLGRYKWFAIQLVLTLAFVGWLYLWPN